MNLDRPDTVAALIDHTLLKPESSRADVERVCAEARRAYQEALRLNPGQTEIQQRLTQLGPA